MSILELSNAGGLYDPQSFTSFPFLRISSMSACLREAGIRPLSRAAQHVVEGGLLGHDGILCIIWSLCRPDLVLYPLGDSYVGPGIHWVYYHAHTVAV